MPKYKILIVDDQHWIRIMLDEVLSNSGFKVFRASNYIEALEIAKNDQPDIVVLDVNLPDIDGLNLLPKLKMVKPDIQAVFISGSPDKNYIRKAK